MKADYRKIKLFAMDFDGVLTDNFVYVSDEGREFVRCTRADGIGLQKLRSHGIELLVLSTEENSVVSKRCEKLNLKYFHGVKNKADFLREYIEKKGIRPENVAFVGNDENDLDVLKIVGFPFVAGDSHPNVKNVAKYVTKKSGGTGAVREICDLIDDSFGGGVDE
ncbi:MAG: HAD hydrolase family protein [Candidatus Altiarchaeota archaeon]|nr:HAD hydrolase family protein [Candidatus Altiarchaeota archaeon]